MSSKPMSFKRESVTDADEEVPRQYSKKPKVEGPQEQAQEAVSTLPIKEAPLQAAARRFLGEFFFWQLNGEKIPWRLNLRVACVL